MQPINVNIEDSLFSEIDQAANNLAMTRDEFIHMALQRAIYQQRAIAFERKHAEGYAKHPQTVEEVEEWESEQVWGEI